MSTIDKFEDGVLLRLRRLYSSDEAVALISAKLSEKEIEVGVLKSEVAELKYLLSEIDRERNQFEYIKTLRKQLDKYNADLAKDERIVELKRQLTASKESRKKMKATLDLWQNKYFSIERKLKYMAN